jgi:hypothetical protein
MLYLGTQMNFDLPFPYFLADFNKILYHKTAMKIRNLGTASYLKIRPVEAVTYLRAILCAKS